MAGLGQVLTENVREASLWEPLEGGRVRCLACGHRCPIPDGQSGVCKVRFHRNGRLYAPWGYAAGIHCDPIEKKPFFHALPGSGALSFGMLGCDLHCGYCQNWVTSQAVRDPKAVAGVTRTSPREIVSLAIQSGAAAVVSTYNEPLITAEWADEVFRHAHQSGLVTGMVSNGNATPEVLEFLRPRLDLFKVDLKTFDDARYRQLGGRLEPVLESIGRIHRMGYWLEIVTLVVPGFNDSGEELRRMAEFIAGVSPLIPWHLTAFHPDYKMTGLRATPPEMLARGASIARRAGLRYVYTGNIAGGQEDTRCHACGELLVVRRGYRVHECRVSDAGLCPACNAVIPGRWRV